MANGSFGLSGLPSAPTTVSGSSSIVTPFTQTEVTLASVNGFSSGDLVYQYNGDYQPINSTATSSATFPVETQKVTRANAGDTGFQQVFSNRFSKGRKPVATLSNGNVVWTYLKWGSGSTYYPYFTITDENNNVVVAETVIESVTAPNNQLGPSVVALSGGGFVIAWINSSNNFRYGVYTNAGAVTTALQNDTGVTAYSGNYEFDLAARPVSGGFVFTVLENGTNIVKHRVYGATGTATYAWTSNNTLAANYWPRVAVRSDDSFVVTSINNSTNLYIYYLWTSTNTAVTNSSFSAVPTSIYGIDVCTLSNDVYILVAGTATGLFYRTLTGSTLSGTSVKISPTTSVPSSQFVAARPLTSGGWAVVYTLSSGIDVSLQFVSKLVFVNVYNSAGTLLSVTYKGSSTAYTGFPYNYIPGSNNENTYFGLTETTNYIHVTTDGYASNSKTMQWARLNKTTYIPVPFTTATTASSNTSALSTAAYAPSGSTVTSAAFYAASTTSVGWRNPDITSASFNAASMLVDTNMYRIETTDSTSLSDGKVVLVYSGYQNTPSPSVYYQKFILFGSNGSQLTLPTIINSNASSLGLMRVQGLSNGKFVIWANSTLYIYSSSGVQLTSIATTYSVDVNRPINLAALSGGRFAVVTMDSGNTLVQLFVYDDNLSILFGPTTVIAGNLYPSVVTTIGNNIYVFYSTSAGTISRILEYVETSTNTWTVTGSANTLSQSGKPCAAKANSFNNGSLLFTYWDGSSTVYAYQLNVDGSFYGAITGSGMTSLPGTLAGSQFNSGITSNGTVILAYNPSSTATTQMQIAYAWAGYNSAVNTVNVTGTYPSDGSRPTISGFQGERVMVAYVSRDPTYSRDSMAVAIFNMGNFQGTQPIVAGSSISNASTALSPSTGFRLVGVATSTAPAGGTGTVAINGVATLNSTYQSIASPGQSFDFSGPVAFGAAGSVIGRNVTLQGNV